MITLREINEKNYRQCFNLKVKEDQKGFVATNTVSLAQAWVFNEFAKPYVIYNDEEMIGFVMFSVPSQYSERFYIWRFMIDEKFQNKGYGKESLKVIIEYLKSLNAKEIFLNFEPHNEKAKKLYQSFGFIETGVIDEGELEMVLKL